MSKRIIAIAMVVICFAFCLTSCKSEEVHVKNIDGFYKACLKAQDKNTKLIVLDNDLEWDPKQYSLNVAYKTFQPDVTGVTIDLNGHTISGVSPNSLNLFGDSFTVKNGTILAAKASEGYSLVLNWFEDDDVVESNVKHLKERAMAKWPAEFEESDPIWAKRIHIENMTLQGFGSAYTPVEMTNVNIVKAQYKGIQMWGSCGVFTNVDIDCKNEFGLSVGHWGKVLLKGSGTIQSVSCAVYAVECANIRFDEGSSYVLRPSDDTATKTIYSRRKSAIIISSGTTVQTLGKRAIAMTGGSYIEIHKGATVYNYKEIAPNMTGFYKEACDYVNWGNATSYDKDWTSYEGQSDFVSAYINDMR